MKLRIQENSLRLRLTQNEVARLRNQGRIESFIEFGPGHTLGCLLEGSFHASDLTATFDGQSIRVIVPTQVLAEWIESDQVNIRARSQAGVQLLVEKDFQCLHKPGHQDPNAYPHPIKY